MQALTQSNSPALKDKEGDTSFTAMNWASVGSISVDHGGLKPAQQ